MKMMAPLNFKLRTRLQDISRYEALLKGLRWNQAHEVNQRYSCGTIPRCAINFATTSFQPNLKLQYNPSEKLFRNVILIAAIS